MAITQTVSVDTSQLLYGLFLIAAFYSGLSLLKRESARLDQSQDRLLTLMCVLVPAAMVGSRLSLILYRPSLYLSDPWEIMKIWNGGLIFTGGLWSAFLALWAYCHTTSLPLWKTADILTLPLALAQSVGFLGCLVSRCRYEAGSLDPVLSSTSTWGDLGNCCDGIPWGRLSQVAGSLVLFAVLWFWRQRKTFDGQLFWGFVFFYALGDSLIKTAWPSPGEVYFGRLSSVQIAGTLMAGCALGMMIRLSKKRHESNSI